MEQDLFGNEYDPAVVFKKKRPGPWQRRKSQLGYRVSMSKYRRCKFCKWLFFWQYSRKYYKCNSLGASHSCATDIRLRNVCDNFTKGD